MITPEQVTLVRNAIHNPGEPRHFMRVVPADQMLQASVDGQVIAESSAALVVKEIAGDIYDPVIYFPRADVSAGALVSIDKSTHCPLKGDTEYFDLIVDGRQLAESAWSYVDTIDVEGVDVLRGLVAFDTDQVVVS